MYALLSIKMEVQFLIPQQEVDTEIHMALPQDGVVTGYFMEQKEILKEMVED